MPDQAAATTQEEPEGPLLATAVAVDVGSFAATLHHPSIYTQRFVEKLAFEPRGGQRWTRTLQILIPEDAQPRGSALRVVSLGSFKRRRLTDITVVDASGSSP